MHTFVDQSGRIWEVAINVAAMKRVRGLLGLDLYKLVDDGAKPLAALLEDPCHLVDLLYVLCHDQADRWGVGDEAFGRMFAGDTLAAGADAFLEELIDFFPATRGRQALRSLIAKSRILGDRLASAAETQVAKFDPEALDLDQLASSLAQRSSGSSTITPARSA